MDLQDCLDFYKKTDHTVFKIAGTPDHQTPLAGYKMVVVYSDEYYFFDPDGHELTPDNPTWAELEYSIDWYYYEKDRD
jgi:hypothetical protein